MVAVSFTLAVGFSMPNGLSGASAGILVATKLYVTNAGAMESTGLVTTTLAVGSTLEIDFIIAPEQGATSVIVLISTATRLHIASVIVIVATGRNDFFMCSCFIRCQLAIIAWHMSILRPIVS
jgi:hypothetical protein